MATLAQIWWYFWESQGALELSSTELSFDIDEGRDLVHVKTKLDLPMNWIVAEMMIFVNSCVVQEIYESFMYFALLWLHRPPKLDNFCLLLELCEARRFILDISNNKALASSLHRMQDSNDPTIEGAFKALATQAMSEAKYIYQLEKYQNLLPFIIMVWPWSSTHISHLQFDDMQTLLCIECLLYHVQTPLLARARKTRAIYLMRNLDIV